MYFNYDFMNRPTIPKMYIAYPNNKIIRPLIGIKTAKINIILRDIWFINFEVDKYISGSLNPSYEYILHTREVLVENIGWFRINSCPTEQCSSDGRWYKTFTAYGYETTLQDLDIVGININCGTEDSVEMYEENLNLFGIPKHNIQLYIKDSNDDPTSEDYWKLGLLNILEHEYLYMKGWKIGDIDPVSALLRGRQFEIDNQNIYSFLTQDVASAYKCIFLFDRINKTINAVRMEKLGDDINLVFTLRNFVNSITITDQNENFFTRFRVSGSNSDTALLEYVNYGSDKLENLDFAICNLDEDTIIKYQAYKEFVDSHRQEYADYSLTFLKLREERDVYYDQVPIAEVDMLFTNVSNEELALELSHFTTILTTLEGIHTDENGVLNIEGTTDYAMYVSVRDVIIPKIQAEIDAREAGQHAETFDYKTNWELYGINELTNLLKSYESQIDILKKYDTPWNETESAMTESTYNRQHELCEKYRSYVVGINKRLEKLNTLVSEIDTQISANNSAQRELSAKAKLTHPDWEFSENELLDIYALYRDTDFQDSTIEVLETDTIEDIIQLAWQLFNSAKEQMEIESHPQLSYETSLDNLFHVSKFTQKANNINVGDFCFLELDDGYKTKQRIIKMEFELVDFNDNDVRIEFSDMVTVCGKADDYRFLLENSGSSSKNQLTKKQITYIDNGINTAALQLFSKYFQDGTVFPDDINSSDIQKMQDALNGLVEGFINKENFQIEVSKIDSLENNSPFLRYLKSQLANSSITVENLIGLTTEQLEILFTNNPFANRVLQIIDEAIEAYNSNIIDSILDKSHPIGSLFYTENPENPTSYLGGTWIEWESGTIPISVDESDDNLSEPNIIIEDCLLSYIPPEVDNPGESIEEPIEEIPTNVIIQRKKTCYIWKRTA